MKNLLIIFLFISSAAQSQIISLIWHGDTLWARNPLNSDSVQISNKTVPWSSVMSKPSTYAVATHSHSIADITNLQSSLDAKGTSNFDGAYSSLTGKPTLFDGTWASLTGKPSISGTNTGDQDLSGYAPVTRTVNTHPLSGNVTVTASDVGLGNVTNTSDANKPVSTAQQTALDLKANLASPTFTGTVSGITASMVGLGNVTNESKATMFTSPAFTGTPTGITATHVGLGNVTNESKTTMFTSPTFTGTVNEGTVTQTGKTTTYNNIATVGVGMPSIVATIDATAQAANIATSTLYAVPSAGFYRVSIYITVTQAATTSSTMPSTTITYTDGNAGTNAHSTTTTATNASNSVTTSFAQTTYVLYAKASTNIQYATGSYASSGGTPMQYALRIRVESL